MTNCPNIFTYSWTDLSFCTTTSICNKHEGILVKISIVSFNTYYTEWAENKHQKVFVPKTYKK